MREIVHERTRGKSLASATLAARSPDGYSRFVVQPGEETKAEGQWTLRADDRPYLPPARSSHAWLVWLVVIALIATGGAYSYYLYRRASTQVPPPAPPAAVPVPQAAAPETAPPAIRYPVQSEPAPGLPSLENSDSMLRDAIAKLIGQKAFADLVIPDGLVRRIVATVDNLPRATMPRRMLPLNPVRGRFAVAGAGEQASIDAKNSVRYEPYVRVAESVDAHALVQTYAHAYPLFQRAYEELGFPGKYFNDRLIEAIDDLLAAPEPQAPPRLAQTRVLYAFADPDLEGRSAGQKILLRMGRSNELRVKAKLKELRRELVASAKEMKP